MKYPNRIRELRVKAGYSQAKTAKLLGVSDTAFQNYEYGYRNVPGDIVAKLAEIFSTTSDYVLMVTNTPSRIERTAAPLDQKDDGYVNVPIYGEIAAGTPIDMLEFEDEFPIPVKLKKRYPLSGLLRVKGNSYNKEIPNGYLALIDFSDKDNPKEGEPYAVCVNGYSATIKAIEYLENGVKLLPNSYDPTCVPIIYDYNKDDTEEVTTIGKVVWATMPFDYEL